MASESFNPNPTIFVPTKTKTANTFAKRNSIWLNDPEIDSQEDEDDQPEVDGVEEIDQDEVFGMSSPLFQISFLTEFQDLWSMVSCTCFPYTSYATKSIVSTDAGVLSDDISQLGEL